MYEWALASRISKGRRSLLLLGPRQVGKSTFLSSLNPDWTINLASPATFRDYVSRPERLETELHAVKPGTRTVFIDEVQRVPALLDPPLLKNLIVPEYEGGSASSSHRPPGGLSRTY